jgi:hypothetical protein
MLCWTAQTASCSVERQQQEPSLWRQSRCDSIRMMRFTAAVVEAGNPQSLGVVVCIEDAQWRDSSSRGTAAAEGQQQWSPPVETFLRPVCTVLHSV